MKLSKARGEIYHFKKALPRFQRTYGTPPGDLTRFVATILSTFPIEEASILIDQVVFEPKHLLELLRSKAFELENCLVSKMVASGPQEAAELLKAALSDWVDFLFIPTPKRFAVYADHDGRTTLFAESEIDLQSLSMALESARLANAGNYTRF